LVLIGFTTTVILADASLLPSSSILDRLENANAIPRFHGVHFHATVAKIISLDSTVNQAFNIARLNESFRKFAVPRYSPS
jgi:hypothetical protein